MMEEQALGIEALRSEMADLRRRLQEAEMRSSTLRDLIDCVPGAVWESWFVEDPSRGRVGYVSGQILDMTGYTPAEWLAMPSRAARSVTLLGAEPMLTGIRPEVAQTLVSMGIDLSGIGTHSTLQTGIAQAMRRARTG
ncbi:STAS domain-containing protein [Polyangium mundeleinium]|uniref:STAS domain-containing protein n=1 Tax=Polyangium mundeleinium TaxID=2995306 RepID=A0ABT5EFF3_9BACT|nr:STAS domain-containing protein [Polyangium mundeleinium]MDC0740535.1 STAS domain-containing protein [Polyangium mundeleinium]